MSETCKDKQQETRFIVLKIGSRTRWVKIQGSLLELPSIFLLSFNDTILFNCRTFKNCRMAGCKNYWRTMLMTPDETKSKIISRLLKSFLATLQPPLIYIHICTCMMSSRWQFSSLNVDSPICYSRIVAPSGVPGLRSATKMNKSQFPRKRNARAWNVRFFFCLQTPIESILNRVTTWHGDGTRDQISTHNKEMAHVIR